MANNVFQVKRTNVTGRTPNTTGSYGTNSQYIAAGEFALNMADGILYTSNGSAVITVGSNLVNQNITGNLTVKAIIANGSIGTAGQVLTTNSTGVYWSTAGGGSGTVTSVATGNGMTGGPITTTGTVSILANTGIVANSTGLFVNSAYIGTLTANNANYFGGALSNTFIKNNSLVQYFNAFVPSNTVNKYYSSITTNRFLGRASQLYVTVNGTPNSSIASVISDGGFESIYAMGTAGGANVVVNINFVTNGLTGATGFTYSSGEMGVYFYPGRHPSALTARYKNKDGIWTTATVSNNVYYATDTIGFKLTNFPGNYVTDVEITMTPNPTLSLGLTEIEYHGSRMGLSEGPFVTVGGATFYGNIIQNANLTISNTGNLIFTPNAGIIANNGYGAAGHVLHSNGSAVYWAADDQGVTSVATGNGMTGGAITTTGTVSVLANTGIVANSTGTFVNAAYIATIASNSALYANASITNTFTVGTGSYFVSNGNVGIGTATPAYKLEVNGSFAATTKSFVINHPTKESQFLRYGSLEGPENGVYVRGRLDGKSIIELPDYWWNLIDESSITVNITPIGRSQDLWVQSTSAYFIHLNQPADCFFTVFAERKDVDKLVVEY